jgi:DNA-directed RNA polymerase subunit RPC12/RpoP
MNDLHTYFNYTEDLIMICCAKCGKPVKEHFRTAYGEVRCEDCWYDHLMTDKGKVEYLIGICNEDYPMSDFDADFLGHVAVCWKKYRNELSLHMSQIAFVEDVAERLGLL